ncbi:Thiamine biosynthesis lipoprotein ApbE precursor [Leclercia adecarboxylata]|uniref:Thiamine biosynthesis lipoprotein ApbE n=1 Tax=Leclercia adecarboxylata TaxID=83655 RepID=A0A4U9I8D3_9ENTR|nr:Thiamine biosynthesis lipoprotein ApbE precursor [Leclercia adecarboxylata]
MVLGTEKAKEIVREQGLAVYMITREGEGFKNLDVPAVRQLPRQRGELKSKIAGFCRVAFRQARRMLR